MTYPALHGMMAKQEESVYLHLISAQNQKILIYKKIYIHLNVENLLSTVHIFYILHLKKIVAFHLKRLNILWLHF